MERPHRLQALRGLSWLGRTAAALNFLPTIRADRLSSAFLLRMKAVWGRLR